MFLCRIIVVRPLVHPATPVPNRKPARRVLTTKVLAFSATSLAHTHKLLYVCNIPQHSTAYYSIVYIASKSHFICIPLHYFRALRRLQSANERPVLSAKSEARMAHAFAMAQFVVWLEKALNHPHFTQSPTQPCIVVSLALALSLSLSVCTSFTERHARAHAVTNAAWDAIKTRINLMVVTAHARSHS